MNEQNDEILESSPEEVAEEVEANEVPEKATEEAPTPVIREDVKPPAPSAPKKTEDRVVPYSRFKEVNDELARLKERPAGATKSLEVDDFINISASLEGLDQQEKSYLAEQHKLTGLPLSEIRNGENFLLWQNGYKLKVEKERALKPKGAQADEKRPQTVNERLSAVSTSKNYKANLAEQEKILMDAGLYKAPRPNPNRPSIG
jgi:hypothetical protein